MYCMVTTTGRLSHGQIVLVVVLVLVIQKGRSRTKDENEKFAQAAKNLRDSSTECGRATYGYDLSLK